MQECLLLAPSGHNRGDSRMSAFRAKRTPITAVDEFLEHELCDSGNLLLAS